MSDRAPRPVLLVASSGGHLLQLLTLRAAWQGLPTIWVSNDKEDARSLLAGEDAHFLPGPYSRNIRSLVANLRLAIRLVLRERPATVLTTGADIAVPFAWIARLMGARVVYVESFTRIETVSLPWLGDIALGWLSLPATMLWIAAVINAMNLIDGLDGLAGGVVTIISGSRRCDRAAHAVSTFSRTTSSSRSSAAPASSSRTAASGRC